MLNSAMSNRSTFKKSERVCSHNECNALFGNSLSLFCFPYKVVYRFTDNPDSTVRLLVSVPKRSHKRAVHRNKLKRRTREAFRLNKGIYYNINTAESKGVDIALIYVSKKQESYEVISESVKKILEKVAILTRESADTAGTSGN